MYPKFFGKRKRREASDGFYRDKIRASKACVDEKKGMIKMATHEEEQKTILNDNKWQNWKNNSIAKEIKPIWKNAVAKQDYVNKLKSKNTAIRPYYYQQGSQYGLDKNTIDRLFGYDNGTGRVSFDGEDLGKPVVEDNGTSYWNETYLSNKWNDFVKKNGLNKIGAKSQNNSTVTEGFRPYDDVNNIYKQKQNWASAAAKGDVTGQNAAANAALNHYNSLRENGYGSVADELEAADGSDDFAKKYYGMIGLVPFRDYLYQKGAADGLSKSDIDKRISYNDVTGEISFNGQNLGKPLSEINGTSYWQSGDLDNLYTNFMKNGGENYMSDEARSNRLKTAVMNNSTELYDRLKGKQDERDAAVYKLAKDAENIPSYESIVKSIMGKYDLSAMQGRDNAAASAAASNGGNIDSYAAANAMRQQAALTQEGMQTAHKLGLEAYNARIGNVRTILENLGVQQNNDGTLLREANNDIMSYAKDFNSMSEEKKNSEFQRQKDIAEVTGYVPTEWQLKNNRYLNEDGTVKDEYKDTDFKAIANAARAAGNTAAADEALLARYYKITGDYNRYGQFDDGDYLTAKSQRTLAGRDADTQNKISIANVTGYVPREWAESDNPFLKEDGTVKDEYMTKEFDDNGGFAAMIANTSDEVTKQYLREARTKKMLGNMGKYGQYISDGDIFIRPREETADIDQANKDRQSAQDIAFNQTDTERYITDRETETDKYITDREVEADKYATDAKLANNGGGNTGSGGKTGSGSKSGGSSGSSKPSLTAAQAKTEIEEGNITDATVEAYNYYYKTNYTKDSFNTNPSGNMEAWINWTNIGKNNFEYDPVTGYPRYVGDGNYDTKVVLVQAALNDGKLTENEKRYISNMFGASVLDEALGRIRRGQGN